MVVKVYISLVITYRMVVVVFSFISIQFNLIMAFFIVSYSLLNVIFHVI